MRLLPRRRLAPLKLVILAGAIFVVVLVILLSDPTSSFTAEPWLLRQVEKKDKVMMLVQEAAKNLGFQMPVPSQMEPTKNNPCPDGFYSKDELKPHWERPPQDPEAPGANGGAFQKNLSPQETKEKENGMAKHCFNLFASDRISLSRRLGDDTRPPE